MRKAKIRKAVTIVILLVILVIILTPLWWAVVLSFDRAATTALPPFSWLPYEATLFNYKAAAKLIDLARYYGNTIFITIVNTLISVFFSLM